MSKSTPPTDSRLLESYNKQKSDKKRLAELKAQAKRTEKSAQSEKNWEAHAKKADEMMARGMESYQDWVSAMNSIVQTSKALNKAIGLGPLSPFKLLIKVCVSSGKFIKELFEKTQPIIFSVKVDSKGKLHCVAEQEKLPLLKEDQEIFDTGIVAWGKSQGYNFDPKTGSFLTEKNEPLKPEDCKLLNDKFDGLTGFLSSHFGMAVQEKPATRRGPGF